MSIEHEPGPAPSDMASLRRRIDAIQWFHNWELLPGVWTNGWSDMAERLPHFQIPEDLHGLRVLDIGCADGYYSFLAEARGAEVVSIDATPRAGYALAHEVLESKAAFHHMSVYDIDPGVLGLFDLVFFFGVYYHLKHPLLALERIASVTRGCALIESEVSDWAAPGDVGASLFLEGSELNNDPTNWWMPNVPCLVQTVRAAGFPRAELVGQYAGGSRAIVRAQKGPRTAGKVLSEDITLILDAPLPGAQLSGESVISGWTLHQLAPEDGIERVSIYLDRLDDPTALLGEAECGLPRADLAASVNPIYGDVGFRFIWNVQDVAPGPYEIHVLVEGKGQWHHESIPVVVGERDDFAGAELPPATENEAPILQEAPALRRMVVERDAEIERLQTLVRGYEQGRLMRLMASLRKLGR